MFPEGPCQVVLVFTFVGEKVSVVLGEAQLNANPGLLPNEYEGAAVKLLMAKVVNAVHPASSVTETV